MEGEGRGKVPTVGILVANLFSRCSFDPRSRQRTSHPQPLCLVFGDDPSEPKRDHTTRHIHIEVRLLFRCHSHFTAMASRCAAPPPITITSLGLPLSVTRSAFSALDLETTPLDDLSTEKNEIMILTRC